MLQFQLISAETSYQLNSMVNDKLAEGWKLYGPPGASLAASPTSSKIVHRQFTQAVVFDDIPEEERVPTEKELKAIANMLDLNKENIAKKLEEYQSEAKKTSEELEKPIKISEEKITLKENLKNE